MPTAILRGVRGSMFARSRSSNSPLAFGAFGRPERSVAPNPAPSAMAVNAPAEMPNASSEPPPVGIAAATAATVDTIFRTLLIDLPLYGRDPRGLRWRVTRQVIVFAQIAASFRAKAGYGVG